MPRRKLARQTRIGYLRKALDGGLILLAAAMVGLLIWRVIGPGRGFGWVVGISAVVASILVFGSLAALNLSNPRRQLVGTGRLARIITRLGRKSRDLRNARQGKYHGPSAGKHRLGRVAEAARHRNTLGRIARVNWSTISARSRFQESSCSPTAAKSGPRSAAAIEAAQEAAYPHLPDRLGFRSPADQRPNRRIRRAGASLSGRQLPGHGRHRSPGAGRPASGRRAGFALGRKALPANNWNIEGQQSLTLPTDGQKERVKFQLPGIKEPGRRTLQLRVKLPDPARNRRGQLRPIARSRRRNRRSQESRAAHRRRSDPRVSIPPQPITPRSRDDRRRAAANRRAPASSQDANQILDHFPASMQELSQYDTIVAFDPNWQSLESDPTANAERIDLLERWVSEEAGGLVLIAGPVNMDDWVQRYENGQAPGVVSGRVQPPAGAGERREVRRRNARRDRIHPRRAAKPNSSGSDSTGRRRASTSGSEFKGVYGYYRVHGKKPGATVYARFADPDLAGSGDELPIYMAGQLYGAGRVFYLGSGEMWRLRAMEESYFEQLLHQAAAIRFARADAARFAARESVRRSRHVFAGQHRRSRSPA